jgi:hypothetical protein
LDAILPNAVLKQNKPANPKTKNQKGFKRMLIIVSRQLKWGIKNKAASMRLPVDLPMGSWRDCFRRGRWRDFALRLIPPPGSRITSTLAKVDIFNVIAIISHEMWWMYSGDGMAGILKKRKMW